ncbi:MAG: CsbD family protein [Elusimicrobia bacterium]|nr:CsbD family protein [Elusimicrobiota bacterium]
MAPEPIKGDWKKLRALVAREWEELTDADLDDIAGDRERLVEKIGERCGVGRDEAEKELRDFERIAGAAAGF